MASTVVKSLSSDFGGTWNQSQLHTEIEAEGGITTALTGINHETGSDDIDIVFASALSGPETTALNSVISAHSPEANVGSNISNISIPDNQIDLTTYVTIATFNFPGTNKWKDVTHIKVISVMEEGGTSYDVRVFDVTNNLEIASANWNNTDEDICDFGTLNNLPTGESILELHAKVNGSSVAHIKNMNIYYD
jgi:hypothetical protein